MGGQATVAITYVVSRVKMGMPAQRLWWCGGRRAPPLAEVRQQSRRSAYRARMAGPAQGARSRSSLRTAAPARPHPNAAHKAKPKRRPRRRAGRRQPPSTQRRRLPCTRYATTIEWSRRQARKGAPLQHLGLLLCTSISPICQKRCVPGKLCPGGSPLRNACPHNNNNSSAVLNRGARCT
jgi:hypothetical protein